ncbi:MAG TPA: stalk domain-containing protein [Caldisericia bacterium]|nr:stalk domain-containing protein [Caldisericia bacterium]HRV75693.1 stalk domain-containing protein [Caldisericia bacterium]
MNLPRVYAVVLLAITLLVPQITIGLSSPNAVENLNFTAEPLCGSVLLSWSNAYPGSWYMPEMVLSNGNTYPLIDYAIQDTQFIHEGVENNQKYCYVLKVVDRGDNELYSSTQICATPHCDKGEVPGTRLDCDGKCMLFLCFQIDNKEAQVTWAEESFLSVIENGGLVDENGKIISNTTLNTPPIIDNGRTCAGPRDITDNIPGADIGWDANEQRVDMTIPTIIYGDETKPSKFNNLKLWIGKSKAEINGAMMPIDPTNISVKPFIDSNNRTQVPVRWISENTGVREVKWLPESRIAVFVFDVEKCSDDGCGGLKTRIGRFEVLEEGHSKDRRIMSFEDCETGEKLEMTVVDKLLQNTPNSGYAKIKHNAKKEIVEFEYLPDMVNCPPPVDCQWSATGEIIHNGIAFNNDHSLQLDTNCDGQADLELYSQNLNLMPVNYPNQIETPLLSLGRYKGKCAKFCYNENIQIVQWEAYPFEMICCEPAPPPGCDEFLPCVIKYATKAKAQGGPYSQSYSNLEDNGIFTEEEIESEENLLDETGEFYLNSYKGCASFCLENGKIISWEAHPDPDNCCNYQTLNLQVITATKERIIGVGGKVGQYNLVSNIFDLSKLTPGKHYSFGGVPKIPLKPGDGVEFVVFTCSGFVFSAESGNEPTLKYDTDDCWVGVNGSIYEPGASQPYDINVSNNSVKSDTMDEYNMILDSDGNPHIAWQDHSDGDADIYYVYWSPVLCNWLCANGVIYDPEDSQNANVSNTPGTSVYPSLALGSAGKPHIAWAEGEEVSREIFYTYWNGNSWAYLDNNPNVSNNTGKSDMPSLRLDSSDAPHIVWEDDSMGSGNKEIYYVRWSNYGWVGADGVVSYDPVDAFMQPEINVSNNISVSANPCLELDESGNPHIVWDDVDVGANQRDIFYSKWNGNVWLTASNVSNTPERNSAFSTLRLHDGKPHIVWREDTTTAGGYDACYIKFNGNIWVGADETPYDTGNFETVTDINVSRCGNNWGVDVPTFELDSSGNPHVVWDDSYSNVWSTNYVQWSDTEHNWICIGDGGLYEPQNNNANITDTLPSTYAGLQLFEGDLNISVQPHLLWTNTDDNNNSDVHYVKWDCSPESVCDCTDTCNDDWDITIAPNQSQNGIFGQSALNYGDVQAEGCAQPGEETLFWTNDTTLEHGLMNNSNDPICFDIIPKPGFNSLDRLRVSVGPNIWSPPANSNIDHVTVPPNSHIDFWGFSNYQKIVQVVLLNYSI